MYYESKTITSRCREGNGCWITLLIKGDSSYTEFESVEETCESDYMKCTLCCVNKNTDEWMVWMILKLWKGETRVCIYGTLINIFISLRSTYLIAAVRGWWEIEQETTAPIDRTQSVLTLLTKSQYGIQIILQNVVVASFVIAKTLFLRFLFWNNKDNI